MTSREQLVSPRHATLSMLDPIYIFLTSRAKVEFCEVWFYTRGAALKCRIVQNSVKYQQRSEVFIS